MLQGDPVKTIFPLQLWGCQSYCFFFYIQNLSLVSLAHSLPFGENFISSTILCESFGRIFRYAKYIKESKQCNI